MKQAVDFLEVIPWGREFQISPLILIFTAHLSFFFKNFRSFN